MSVSTGILMVLVFLLLGALPVWSLTQSLGYYPSLVLALAIIGILLFPSWGALKDL